MLAKRLQAISCAVSFKMTAAETLVVTIEVPWRLVTGRGFKFRLFSSKNLRDSSRASGPRTKSESCRAATQQHLQTDFCLGASSDAKLNSLNNAPAAAWPTKVGIIILSNSTHAHDIDNLLTMHILSLQPPKQLKHSGRYGINQTKAGVMASNSAKPLFSSTAFMAAQNSIPVIGLASIKHLPSTLK